MSRARLWTPYEAELLRASYSRGIPWEILSRAMGRPAEGLRWKARKLGIIKRRELKVEPRAKMAPDWRALHARLSWQYGPDRTDAIFACRDEASNADIAAWRNFGPTP